MAECKILEEEIFCERDLTTEGDKLELVRVTSDNGNPGLFPIGSHPGGQCPIRCGPTESSGPCPCGPEIDTGYTSNYS